MRVHRNDSFNPACADMEMWQQGMQFSVNLTDADDGGVVLTDPFTIDDLSA
jgi:hypothetical protein